MMTGRRRISEAAVKWLVISSTIIGFSVYASAQDIDVGKREYRANCAACHGIDAKGNGPVSKELKTRPADLAVLAKKNNGVFPLNAVHEIIDGRNSTISSHGVREMPIWGYRFAPPQAPKVKEDYIYSPSDSPEPLIHIRIMAIIDYLSRIQEK